MHISVNLKPTAVLERKKKVEVLVVEDSMDDSELTEFAMLQAKENIQFIHFSDGVDALNFLFRKKNYEGQEIQDELKLIVLDIGLPRLNGFDVLRKIREDKATKMLPVVVLTSSVDKRDMCMAYELGANSYVIKPSGFDGYIKKIGSLTLYWSCINERPYQT